MENNYIALFNQCNEEIELSEMNRFIKNPLLFLSANELVEIVQRKNEILKENHLIDFSEHAQQSFLGQLSQSENLSKKQFLASFFELQEIYYFVHSNRLFPLEDEELIEKIMIVFEEKGQLISHIQAYFEEWLIEKNLKEGESFEEFTKNSK